MTPSAATRVAAEGGEDKTEKIFAEISVAVDFFSLVCYSKAVDGKSRRQGGKKDENIGFVLQFCTVYQ